MKLPRLPALLIAALLPAAALPAQEPGPVLTLDDAIRVALANNRSIKVDAFSREIARANLLAAYGAFEPALNFGRSRSEFYSLSLTSANNGFISYSTLIRTDDYSLSLAGTTPWGLSYSLGGTADNQRGTYNGFLNNYLTTAGITVRQPLLRGFGFGANLVNVRLARTNRAISQAQYRQAVVDTITRVIDAYSYLVLTHEYLRAVLRTRDGAAQLLAENEKRFKVGAVSENDVTSARARAALREQGVLAAERSVRDADNQLRQLMGESTFSHHGPLLAVVPPPPAEAEIQPAEDLQHAYAQRPDYQQARLGLEAYRYSDSAVRTQLLPKVDFVGSYGYTGLDPDFAASRRMVSDRDNRSYSVGVEVSVPLTFAQARGQARAARLKVRQAEADLKRLEADIALSVAAARTAQRLNEQLLEAELKRLRAGTGSTFNVLYQQEYLSTADTQYAAALADQRRAVAEYERTIGATLERHHITLTDQ
jgi:outer membrane protein